MENIKKFYRSEAFNYSYAAISASISTLCAIIAVALKLKISALPAILIVLFASSMLTLNYFRPYISKNCRIHTIVLCACLIGLFLVAIM